MGWGWLFHLCLANLALLAVTIWLLLFVTQILAQEYRWHQGMVREGIPEYISRWVHFVVNLSQSLGQELTRKCSVLGVFAVAYEDRHCRCSKCLERRGVKT